MKESIKYCYDQHIIRKVWNKTNAKAFLQQKGFSENIRDKVLSLTENDDVYLSMPPCWAMNIFEEDE